MLLSNTLEYDLLDDGLIIETNKREFKVKFDPIKFRPSDVPILLANIDKMKKLGFATVIASGLAAAVLGFAGPAQADSIHHDWVHDIQQQVSVPQVDSSVQQSR